MSRVCLHKLRVPGRAESPALVGGDGSDPFGAAGGGGCDVQGDGGGYTGVAW